MVDAIIDSRARVVALSGDKPEFAQIKATAMSQLPEPYMFRRGQGSTAGLDTLIADSLRQPFVPYSPK